MKKQFSNKWIGSKQPRKQRKYKANAPLHIKHKMMGVNLNKDLKKKYGRRNFPLRKGDSVRIMSGEFKKKTGKIEIVDVKKLRVSIEGLQRTKKDGTKINVWFSPSNLQIKELNLEDKKRRIAVERNNKKEDNQKTTRLEDKSEDKKNASKKK